MINRNCKHCSKLFFNSHKSTQYCSPKCGAAKRIKGSYKNCLNCSREFWAFAHKLKEGKGKYCSITCGHSVRLKGELSTHWKKENLGYIGIHLWLHKYFGNPQFCEICKLKGSKVNNRWNIDWALIKDKQYERKRENFWGLCRSCHSKYDLTEEKIYKLRQLNINRFKIKV